MFPKTAWPPTLSIGSYFNWAKGESLVPRFHYKEIDSGEDFFIAGFEWLPDRMNYYINGELVGTHYNFGVYGPSFMWLTALAQPEGREDKIDDTLLPGYSEFDYMRYYQMPIKGLNLLGNGHFEYDRQAINELYPRCFYVKGDVEATRSCSTLDAYEGVQCMVQGSEEPFSTFAGHEMKCLLPGKYTFSGMFKAENAPETARMVIFDKDGSVIAEKAIPRLTEWTELSITDIEIDGYAYVAIESSSETGEKFLMVDNLAFFIQDGITYDQTATPDYERYNFRTSQSGEKNYRKGAMDFDKATSVVGNWQESSIGEGAVFAYYSAENALEWEYKATESGMYNLEVYRLDHESTMEKQKYTIYVNEEEKESFLLQTVNVEEGWTVAGKVQLEKDDIVKIKLSPGSTKGTMRFQEINIVPEATSQMYYTPLFKLNDMRMCYKGQVYFADPENKNITLHEKDGAYYIPCVLLKECTEFGLTLPENDAYISLSEVLSQTGAKAIWQDEYLYLAKGFDSLNEATLTTLIIDLLTAQHSVEIRKPALSETVSTLSTTEYGINDALKEGEWKKSSVSILNYYNQGSGRAVWIKKAPETGVYNLQFCSAVHENSTPEALVTVYTDKKQQSFLLNEKTGVAGWYDAGSYELDANEEFALVLSRRENGTLRVAGVRLNWLRPGVSVTQQNASVTVTLSDFAENQSGRLILAEYDSNGFLQNVQQKKASKTETFVLQNPNNSYKIMLWEEDTGFTPISQVYEL